jgi:Mg/Co/Ni transporter MgtE
MNTIENIKSQLTENEYNMLNLILSEYESTDVSCYTKRLTDSQKGIVGSLIKKGMVYDAYEGISSDDSDHNKGNWFPEDHVIEAFGLPAHWPY